MEPRLCAHRHTTWPQPSVFTLEPALQTTRTWRYAECEQLCTDCGQRLQALRVDLRGAHRQGPVYRIVFGSRILEGNSYRLEWTLGGVPTLILQQSTDPEAPVFDVQPSIECSAVDAAFEDDFPFALVRRSGM